MDNKKFVWQLQRARNLDDNRVLMRKFGTTLFLLSGHEPPNSRGLLLTCNITIHPAPSSLQDWATENGRVWRLSFSKIRRIYEISFVAGSNWQYHCRLYKNGMVEHNPVVSDIMRDLP